MKKILLLLFVSCISFAQLKPPHSSGGTVSSTVSNFSTHGFDGGGDIVFLNPTNIQAEDGAFATSAVVNGLNGVIEADTYGFSIPTDATLDSVYFRFKHKKALNVATGYLTELQMLGSDPCGGATLASVIPLTTSLTWDAVGFSASDFTSICGGISVAGINESMFAMVLVYIEDDGSINTISVDAMKVSVKYHTTTIGTSVTILGKNRKGLGI